MQNQYARHRGDLDFVYPDKKLTKQDYVPITERDDWPEIEAKIEKVPFGIVSKNQTMSQMIWRRSSEKKELT